MFGAIFSKVFGSKNERELKKLHPIVAHIESLEPAMKALSESDLRMQTAKFKDRLSRGEKLDEILPEAFATVREASRRVLGMRHFNVQMIGGMVLNNGRIAEMKTGEGKTLVATAPVYLNALTGRGVHVVTVNDYLARRDSEWMGRVYKYLGLSVGIIVHGLTDQERQVSYRADVTYGTNNEFGFDYLRDNMKESIERFVQRELNYAIVDEVDSILIDEARTPLIISGPAEESADLYKTVNGVIPHLKAEVDYTLDEKAHSVMLTDQGVEHVEKKLNISNLYDSQNIEWLHHITQALRAHTLYKKNHQYLVEDGKVIIIDEFTGRKMPGRRWSDGLHQAVEAKENVRVEEENQTLATITFQNYFRMYKKLSGMTGTADTEAEEFAKIYNLDVNIIPTNLPAGRKDYADLIYKTEKGKFKAVLEELAECYARKQPVLVGTVTVEKSEVLSTLLKKAQIPHTVLNAKYHAREAEIVAQAGRKGAITISTNMAGRGTDIVLGGNPEAMARTEVYGVEAGLEDVDENDDRYQKSLAKFREQCKQERNEVLAAGGLHILGTERHEARRIDNQLRGRAGRQGDPGSSRFYLSLEDDLLRIFGAERIAGLMERLGLEEDVPIEHGMVNRAIENAQRKVEGHNFDIRKHLLEYDDVMNQQRKTIYGLRKSILEGRYSIDEAGEGGKDGKASEDRVAAEERHTELEKQRKQIAERLRPHVVQIVDGMFAQSSEPKPPLAKPDAPSPTAAASDGHLGDALPGGSLAATPAPTPTPALAGDKDAHPYRTPPALDSRALKHEVYRRFGAVVEFDGLEADRMAIINKATEEAAASLVQQRERIMDLVDGTIGNLVVTHCPDKEHADEWDIPALVDAVQQVFNYKVNLEEAMGSAETLAKRIWTEVSTFMEAREQELGPIGFLYIARHYYLEEIDKQWIEHLKAMDHLREGIGLRGYGQRDPKQEYKKEGYSMFSEMMERIDMNVATNLFRVQVQREEEVYNVKHKQRRVTMQSGGSSSPAAEAEPEQRTVRREGPKVGRNDPCPCGSGKKYKKCHLGREVAPSL